MLLIKLVWWGLILCFCQNASAQAYQVSISEGSSFILKGTSNVNEFKLIYTGKYGNSTKINIEQDDSKIRIKSINAINLKAEDFKSSNSYITKDFRKMLKVDAYPNFTIEPLIIWVLKKQPNKVNALINLTVAGHTKQELMSFIITNQNANTMQCKGKHKISLKSYALVAPKIAFGAVQVNDEVEIDMVLNLLYKKVE